VGDKAKQALGLPFDILRGGLHSDTGCLCPWCIRLCVIRSCGVSLVVYGRGYPETCCCSTPLLQATMQWRCRRQPHGTPAPAPLSSTAPPRCHTNVSNILPSRTPAASHRKARRPQWGAVDARRIIPHTWGEVVAKQVEVQEGTLSYWIVVGIYARGARACKPTDNALAPLALPCTVHPLTRLDHQLGRTRGVVCRVCSAADGQQEPRHPRLPG